MKQARKRWQRWLFPAALGLWLGTSPAWSDQRAIPLSELLGSTDNALSVLAAEAASEGAKHDVERDRAEEGLQATWGAGYGLVRNIVDTNRAFTYAAVQANAGLNLPMLGAAEASWVKEDKDVGTKNEKEIRANAAHRMAQLDLENAYATYWGAQESLKVIQAYLDSEQELVPKLQLRVQHKLLLESDLLDVQAGYDQARTDQTNYQRLADGARSHLERLVGHPLEAFTAAAVGLPQSVAIDLQQMVDHHPDIAALRAQRDALEQQLKHSTFYGLNANLSVLGAGVKDTSQGGPTGGDVFVGVNFTAPLGVFSANGAEHDRLRANMEEMRLNIQDRSEELIGEVRGAQQQLKQSRQDSARLLHKIQAGSEGLRESYLRGNAFAESGVGTTTTRLQDYYKTALDDIDALVKIWQANVYLRGYALVQGEHISEPGGSGSEIPNDVGSQLADPIVQLDQALHNRSENSMPSATASKIGMNAPVVPAPAATPPASAPKAAAAKATPAPVAQAAGAPAARVAPSPPIAPSPSVAAANPANAQPVARHSQGRAVDGLPRSVSPPLPPVMGAPVKPSPMLTGASFTPGTGQGQLSDTVYRTGASAQAASLHPTALTQNGASPGPAAMAVYVWKSAELIGKRNDEKFWQGLQGIPINRLLLSLNSEQISQAQAQPQALRGFLQAAHRHGVSVELLLGDPSWIQPEHRAKLVSIIDSLRGFDFAGLDLDIEPDQLYKEPLSQAQFGDWMDTLRAAARVSPWPTSVSMHPRYFRDAPYLGWDPVGRLRQAGISQVVLMIYSSNPQHVADVAKPIVSKGDGLRFRIAQSVEPELEPTLSYAHRSPQDFQQSMQQLQTLLAAQPNTDGVVVQAWNDLMRMGYESQIR